MSAAEEVRLVNFDALVCKARATLGSTAPPACDNAFAATSFNRHLQAVWDSQKHVRNVLKNTFNEKNPFLSLPTDVLHLVVHNLDQSDTNGPGCLRVTCRLLMSIVDHACFCVHWEKSPHSLALFRESKLPPPPCKTLNWIFSPAMAGGNSSSNWKIQLQQAQVINMRILDPEVPLDRLADHLEMQQKWQQLVTSRFESAPMLQRLSLTCDPYHSSGMEYTIPSGIFGGSAPCLRLLATTHFRLTPAPAAFHNITTLDYLPAVRRLSRTDLQELFDSLPGLKALKLRIYGVLPYDRSPHVEAAFEEPLKHSLRLLQIYIRRSIPAFVHYLIGADSAPNLMTFQCALRASTWWEALANEIQHHTQVAFGFEITELVLRRPSPSPALRILLHHSRGPEIYSVAEDSNPRLDPSLYAHHPLLKTLSICQFLWPKEAVLQLPALTSLTIFVGRCTQYRNASRYASFDDVFLWDASSAVLEVPLLCEVVILYAKLDRQVCAATPQHACCLRGRMIISVEVIYRVLKKAVLYQSVLLDVIRTSGIDFSETESQWRRQLLEVAHKVEDGDSCTESQASLSSVDVLSRFEEMADAHCKEAV